MHEKASGFAVSMMHPTYNHTMLIVVIYTIIKFQSVSPALLVSKARDQGKVIFVYPKNVQSERDLSECPENTACSVVFRRFWLPPIVERHCRCPAPSECSWLSAYDNNTLALDNRAQLKFCNSLRTLSDCTANQVALKLNAHVLHHTTSKPLSIRFKSQRISHPGAITVECYCSDPHYWAPSDDGDSTFVCKKLFTCKESDVCGFVRIDFYSTSYKCSCPMGQQCVTQDKRTHLHHLLLYTGPVYTSLCTRVNDKDNF